MSSISKSQLEIILSERMPLHNSVSDFLHLHKCVEAYFRRLLYISLRLKNENNEDSEKLIKHCSLNSNEILNKALDLLSQSRQNVDGKKIDFKSIELKYPKFEGLFKYYQKYSSRHRNLYLHGIVEFLSSESVRAAYVIEKKLLLELEMILKKEYRNSCKDTPTTWGAKRITKLKNESKDIMQKMQKYKLGGDKGRNPIQNNSLKKGLKKIFTKTEMDLLKVK